MRNKAVWRIRIITSFILLLVLAIIVRLYFVQIVHHDQYEAKANKQYVYTAQDIFTRGNIYFTNKDGERITAAGIKSGYVLAVNPERLDDPNAVYDLLKPYLTVDRETFLYRATLPDRVYVEIEDTLSLDQGKEVSALSIPGIHIYRNQWRYYPGESLASRTLGFTSYVDGENSQVQGSYGLERYYDAVLQRDSESLSVNFFAEIFTNLGSLLVKNDQKDKGDIVTTIEPTVSRMLQRSLQSTHDSYESKQTGGIIMDPSTGEIYALEVVPDYNNNNRSGVPIEYFSNPLIESVFEFGSIVKPLTVAAGLDAGVITPQTEYFDAGSIEFDKYTIHNYDGRSRGQVPMQEVLNQSLNTGVAYIVDQLGVDSFRDYFLKLGIDAKTGIDLPNESSGLADNLNSPRKIEYATASFGQGIAVTPVSMIQALATLGNGGELVTPHVTAKVDKKYGLDVSPYKKQDKTRVYTKETSETISRMLTKVVDEALAHGERSFPHHTVAAKTGTAQIAHPQGGYYDDRYLHSFFGYFPAYEPRFIVLLYTIEPKNVRYASETLTDPFMEITDFLINYYEIPPDR